MSDIRIAVIVGSTRPGRKARTVAEWVLEQAQGREDATYEIVDLADFPLPHLDESMPAAFGQYAGEHTRAWAEKVASYDGFVFVTPEYNHSISGVLKNALDYLYNEWNNKAAAFVGYGAVGGARAVEHLRAIASELQLAHVRQSLAFSGFTDFENFTTFAPAEIHRQFAATMFDQLEAWSAAMQSVRERELAAVAG